jgi:hypothetical protein
MKEYDILLNIIKLDIENDNTESLEINLARLPLEKINEKTLNKIIALLINKCVEYNSCKSIKSIFKILYQYIPLMTNQLDYITSVFTNVRISLEGMKLVINTFNEKPITYYYYNLITYLNDPIVMIGAKNLELIYGYVDGDIWRYLYNLLIIENNTNLLMKDFLEEKVKHTSLIVKKPPWIINEYDYIPYYDSIEPQLPPLVFNLPDDNIAIKLLTYNIDNQKDIDDIIDEYVNATTEDRKDMLLPSIKNLYRMSYNDDPNFFKVYGPSNILPDQDLTGDDICSMFGCRMLTCNEYNEKDLAGEDIDIYAENYLDTPSDSDWFNGACAYCLNIIEHRHYAVRRPFTSGGWFGCYCSWECVRADTDNSQTIVFELIDIFESKLSEIGIQDRIYR